MPSLLTLEYNDWDFDEQGNSIPVENCSICSQHVGRLYPPGEEPPLPVHEPGYYGENEHVYHCGCYYRQHNLTDQQDDPNHTHPDLVQAVRDLNVIELQKSLLDLTAAVQALANQVQQNP